MKKVLIVLSVLFSFISVKAQNSDPRAYPYDSLAQALKLKIGTGAKFSVMQKVGSGLHTNEYTVRPKNEGWVVNGGTVQSMKDTNYVAVLNMSQTQAINIAWFNISGDASASLQAALNLSASMGLPVDGNGLNITANDITIPAGAALKNISVTGTDSTKTILHMGTVGLLPTNSYQSGLTLDNVTLTGICSYALITSNVTDAHINKLTFANLHTVNDNWYLNDMYEANITAPRFTGDTAGAGKACLYSPKGLNGVNINDLYISSFTDFGVKFTGGTNVGLINAVIQGSVTGLYVTGVTGMQAKVYTENVVNPILIDDAVSVPTSIYFSGGTGFITGPYSTHPQIGQNNGVLVKVKNAQVTFDNIRFAGVYSGSGKNLASVDGSALITLIKPNVTGNLTADIRQYLYKESTATSAAGYNLEQNYTNNSLLRVQRSLAGLNKHISTVINANGHLQESSVWTPPINGSGLQTITDVWKETWTENNLDTSLLARKGNTISPADTSVFARKGNTISPTDTSVFARKTNVITPSDTIGKWMNKNFITNFDLENWNGKLSPSASKVLYFPAFVYERGYEVPNVTGIKDSSLTINGTIGNSYLLVTGGNKVAFYNQGAFPIAVYDGVSTYKTYYTSLVTNDTVYLTTPLLTTVTSGTLKTVHDSYQGQHLTDIAYKALGQYMFNTNKTTAYRNYLAYFDPATNPTIIPFSLIGGATSGGFIPGTDLPQIAQVSSVTTSSSALGSKAYYVAQGTTAGKGVQWALATSGKSGYISTNIGLYPATYNTTLKARGRVAATFYINGVASYIDTISSYNVQNITHSFSEADSVRLTITTIDTIPTKFAVSRTGFYQTQDTLTRPIFNASTIVVWHGDSWTQYTLNGVVPRKDMITEFKKQFQANGGDSNNVYNVGRGGMTSAWGKYWFDSLVLTKHPTYVILEFYTNDNNSSGTASDPSDLRWNFSSTSPYGAGTDAEGKVTATQWNANMAYMAQKALANNITPIIFMAGWSGSISQSQAVMDSFLVKQATNPYYDIKAVNSLNATITNSITADNITTITSGSIPTLTNSTKLTMGSGTVGGYGLLETKETNSSSAKGFVFRPDASRTYTGSVGHLFTIQNGGTDVAYLRNDAAWITSKLLPTTNIVIPASTTIQSALSWTPGSLLNVPVTGAEEFDSLNRYVTLGSGVRKRYVLTSTTNPTNGQINIGNGTDFTLANITGNSGTGLIVTNGSGTINAKNDTAVLSTVYSAKHYTDSSVTAFVNTDTVSTLATKYYSKHYADSAIAVVSGSSSNYTMQLISGLISAPANATTYFAGENPVIAPQLITGYNRVYIPKTGTIKRVVVHFAATVGTNEASTIYIRLNNTTDYTLISTVDNSITNTYTGAQVTIPVTGQDANGTLHDYIELKWITPTWVTKPTGTRFDVTVYIE